MDTRPPSDFICHLCSKRIGERQGDTLIVYGIKLPFKKTQPVECPHCEKVTYFYVDHRTKIVEHKG